MASDSQRAARLTKFLDSVLGGKVPISMQNASRFIEAICSQQDRAACANRIIAGTAGLSSIQSVMRFDVSPAFLNGGATQFLSYLQDPSLRYIGGGEFLNQIIRKIVDPPIFWSPFGEAFKSGKLNETAQLCFGWLLLQLVSLPRDAAASYIQQAQEPAIISALRDASNPEIKSVGHQIDFIVKSHSAGVHIPQGGVHPGGRHDNDFIDFHDIAVFPTTDEIACSDKPFLRTSAEVDEVEDDDARVAVYLDNQFRLLREDLIYEMREELQTMTGKKKGRSRGHVIDDLTLHTSVYFGKPERRCKWGIMLQCKADLPQLKGIKPDKRMAFLKSNPKVVKHQALSCLIVDGVPVAYPIVYRDEELLARALPVIVVQFNGDVSIRKALSALKTATKVTLVLIQTGMFAYEPVLKAIQGVQSLALSPEMLAWREDSVSQMPSLYPSELVSALETDPGQDLKSLFHTSQAIILDKAQAASMLSALKQRLSLIQGPPGTGKSFIGALLAKALHDSTRQRILVCCYTNHALDQFLEDLLNIGIPGHDMVRLGSKSSPRTTSLLIRDQLRNGTKYRREHWDVIDGLKAAASEAYRRLESAYARFTSSSVQARELLDYLEFEDEEYFEAFRVPDDKTDSSSNGERKMTKVGRGGRDVTPVYLLDRWSRGADAGVFRDDPRVMATTTIWDQPMAMRQECLSKWCTAILEELVSEILSLAKECDHWHAAIERQMATRTVDLLRSKLIIGCTTTAAAMYTENIHDAGIDVLLVEEAGEILESHVLTALGPQTKQIILIGDHKQLRPKVNHYELTVEKGNGYDLNRSLFERLVIKGYPHETLSKQHRMRPEISALIRRLTYPDLVDDDRTKNRPDLVGVRDNLVFITHSHPEDNDARIADRKDMGASSSKQNTHEVQMVLKIVRYLAQQGYGTDDMVVLTPYLGQLQKLKDALEKEVDPVLNDLDAHDLVSAGLLPPSTRISSKKKLRLATIDNYQGEESNIVIISLTRSNPNHDIGFMYSSERVNVLLSRARNALIMIGNADTFLKARNPEGRRLWGNLFDMLKHDQHLYDGLPVKCERHLDRVATLAHPVDFDEQCPDGGCKEPCGVVLHCGIHTCPSRCHRISDHSKMPCQAPMKDKCANGHVRNWKCEDGSPVSCLKCDRQTKLAEIKRKKDFELQQRRDAEQAEHLRKIAELEEQIAAEQQAQKDIELSEERRNALEQKQRDLEAAKERTKIKASAPQAPAIPKVAAPKSYNAKMAHTAAAGVVKSTSPEAASPGVNRNFPTESISSQSTPVSEAQDEWERQKNMEGADNTHIDAIMGMIGLEEVKAQVLGVKGKIDTTKRQGTSIKKERFNIVLLGNPGTGKTTVARHYAKFLASVGVLPGDEFVETTGSGLANDGVPGTKKVIEDVLKAGGGAIFIDEAYQLKSENNFQGGQVLDYLLAEMENNIGKLVFILAGYNKQMEKFFEHNPGLTSRVPHKLQFSDYTDKELLLMLELQVGKKWSGRMKVEEGTRGLYARIAVRRLGRGRGKEGFGNARALENMFQNITDRQSKRLTKQRAKGMRPDDLALLREDLIGPDPSAAIGESNAWKKLRDLIGLASVKQSVQNLIDRIDINYRRELDEKEPVVEPLNRVFLGSPGTGKTTVANLYGQILADLGVLSNGEVVMKNPADFVGNVLGASESQTKAILATTVGKVLVIDEAYMLYGASSGGGKQNDPYKTAVIDTIVAEVQSTAGEDRCVLLLGYEPQMVEMFQNVNSGLSRRFAIENAFRFEDFTDPELLAILNLKLKQQDLQATDAAKTVAIEVLGRARNRPNFGNGGEVENLLGQAKGRYQTRHASLPAKDRPFDIIFEPQDFDPEFDRVVQGSDNLKKLFEDIIGCEEIVERLEEYQNTARVMKAQGRDAREVVPTNFVFKGPPGTGKTTTARKMGQVYYDMGFISSAKVTECSASELVGQYVGQTGPKTKQMFERALGQVLFIDEAYRLGEGQFAKEAMDEIVSILTLPAYKGKIVVILAGYDQDMNNLLSVNPGLSSRFPDEIIFKNMEPERCLELLCQRLRKQGVTTKELEDPLSQGHETVLSIIESLSELPSWGNARDIDTLSKQIMRLVYKHTKPGQENAGLRLLMGDVISSAETMLRERRKRSAVTTPESKPKLMQQLMSPPTSSPPSMSTSTTHATKKNAPRRPPKTVPPPEDETPDGVDGVQRDPGVSDRVWKELLAAKRAAADAETKAKEELRALEEAAKRAEEEERKQRALAEELARAQARDAAAKAELRRKQLAEERARAERMRREAELAARRQREEHERRREALAQEKLRNMGVCVAGFQWIKTGGGYYCAGGSHFISDAQLGM
ncbi:P-loop containing nucleoside triphosphate hydrolase protein [Dentipellis sp. KUC8613]|nr:P-loop containing nucleoside triphosphate hydrolase protein [Dentipellis sp. KUC8613]